MQPYKKVAFYTLGCKLNFSETSTIARLFEKGGYAKVGFDESPDVFVINTCSVTDNADSKCRNVVRKALRSNTNAFVAVVGCYAQLKPQEIAGIPGVDMVLGANEKFDILNYINSAEKKSETIIRNTEIKKVKEFVAGYSLGDRTRSFLKVQDGCDYFCSFCTIPLARGTSRSATIEETVKTAKEVAATDVKEVVLTGVNIGDFGKKTEETFFNLIKELDKIEGIERFRISSIEPNLLSDEIIEFVAVSKKFVPHFHIPLQSGSDKILKLMRRRYERELYFNRVKKIKRLMPDCCIGVDVIVGFPSETEKDFLDTYNFLNELEISYLHVFTYSERENTTAIRIKEVVLKEERAKRSKMLHILSEKKKRHFYEQNIGKEKTVLWESENDNGLMQGFTENYIKVKTEYNSELINELMPIKLAEIDRDGIMKSELICEPML
ncbi:MAG: tRNA (N(6)-L-threonylcarbamoyladenosine(37)-C(2))-methylthiotransferase MtaB [Bacteroidetes bacterium]|nr:tRNA (N(6)-L-threonylcarbamoyladenosine(37)-C(2))-methylthiotransferase MtaB [Bacteroidales bacterium AH-315-I05]PCH66568.1 MAG: tRNA (N(6)-L-threonylcarbamoyladenosine(37)-C(2))-methylthiotransferase MtaB [Bacteroidota bacterium]